MGPLDLELNGNMLAFPMDAWNGDDEEVDLCNNIRLNIKERSLYLFPGEPTPLFNPKAR